MRERVASIELDGGKGRGIVCIEERPTYAGDRTKWIVRIELPNGTVKYPAIAASPSRADAISRIDLAYRRGPWDLVFEPSLA